MKLAQVQAIFLLAGIDLISALPIDNQYNKDRTEDPWWLVTTPHGVICLGWRNRVISIEWSNTGVAYPLIDPEGRELNSFKHPVKNGNTQWETGAHAYGFGQTVDILTALKHSIANNDYVKEFWTANPDKEEEKTEWWVTATRNRWAVSDTEPDRVEVTISTKHKSHAFVEFYKTHPNHQIESVWPKKEVMEFRESHPHLFKEIVPEVIKVE